MEFAASKRDIVDEAMKEKRRFRRIRLSCEGRVWFPETQEEAPCRLEDISAGGAFICCEFARAPHGQVVAYLGELGRFEGTVIAVRKDGFSMEFSCSRQRRGKLADQLTIELNRHLLDGRGGASGK